MACRLTVCAGLELKQWQLDDWTSLAAMAVLSAEPETNDEWLAALRRYQPDHQLHRTATRIESLDQVPDDGPWCLLDLNSKTVMAGGEYELPDPQGAYEPGEGEKAIGFPIVWLDTPADWQFITASTDWQERIRQRFFESQQRPRIDARAVLFGRPLFEFLCDAVTTISSGAPCRDKVQQQQLSREIHIRWMMTSRQELGGKTPRELLLADRKRIESDLHHRSEQWSRQGSAPPGLATNSAAYVHGGFGTTEVVLYFDLVRSLLDKAWKLANSRRCPDRTQFIERLTGHRDTWLNQPYEAGETPAELIDLERQRMPVVSSGSHFDCDCPICRAEADGLFGNSPMFMWFDGHHLELEDEFAFSLAESKEQWLEDQKRHASMLAGIERECSTSKDTDHETSLLADSVWETSYVDWNHVTSSERSTQESLFALAFPVAELVSHVKMRSRGRPHVDSLNQAYDQLRRASDTIAARSAAGNLCDTLEGLAHAFPDLVPRCADLQSHVDEVLRRFR